MTNEEKFREVFNIPAEMSIAYPDICSIVDCTPIGRCHNCPLNEGSNWDDEYKEEIRMVKVDKELQTEVVNEYGANIQSTICMEECAELIQAISKMKRGKDNIDNLIEEMADVYIILEQLKIIYGVTDDEIIKWLDAKLDRQRRLLSGGRC